MPERAVELDRGEATGLHQVTVEMDWTADNGADVTVAIYLRHDGTEWWAYQLRTWVELPDESSGWIYYPGEFFSGRPDGEYFRSPLGVAYEGDLVLDTLVVEDLRIEAFGAEFGVDPASDLGTRPARLPFYEQESIYRFQANYALLDVDTVTLILDGDRIEPIGETDLAYAGVLKPGERSAQEIEVWWQEPDEGANEVMSPVTVHDDDTPPRPEKPVQKFMLYMRSDGIDWWVYRIRATVRDQTGARREADLENLELIRTPLGQVYEGDLVAENLELRELRLELSGCIGDRPGLRNYENCD